MNNTKKGKSWEELGIGLGGRTSGQLKSRVCPECKALGYKKDNDYSVSVNIDKGVANCKRCGTVFIVDKGERSSQDTTVVGTFTPPSRENIHSLDERGSNLFRLRRISDAAVQHVGIFQEKDWVAFPYFENGEIVNVKYRKISEKGFKQTPNGKHIVYNYDNCKGRENIVIVEGEMDVLAILSTGIEIDDKKWGVCSVDSGAPNAKDSHVEKKLECITNAYDIFESAKKIYIAVDADANGFRLQKELIRRFDPVKIHIVEFNEVEQRKDANDVLRWDGPLKLREWVENAKEYTPDGIHTFESSWEEMLDAHEHGFAMGSTTYHPSVDKVWMWRTGDVNLLTGYNNDGKSTFLSNLYILKGIKDGWPTAIFSPESLPIPKFFMKQAAVLTGKTIAKGYPHSITAENLAHARDVLGKLVFMVHPREARTLDVLFEKFKYLVRRYGVKIVVLDPLNTIENLFTGQISIEQGVSDLVGRLKGMATELDVAVFLVTHQLSPERDSNTLDYKRPSKYRIKNGGTLSDKADNVMLLWRQNSVSNPKGTAVTIITEKLKDHGLTGRRGEVELNFNYANMRYNDTELGNRSPFSVPTAELMSEIERVHTEQERIDNPEYQPTLFDKADDSLRQQQEIRWSTMRPYKDDEDAVDATDEDKNELPF